MSTRTRTPRSSAPTGTRTGRSRTTRRPSPQVVTDLHRLPEGPAGWRLDPATHAVAIAGLARAREALRLARLANAEAEAAVTTRSVTTDSDAQRADAA